MKKFKRGIISGILFLIFGIGALVISYRYFPFQKKKAESYKTLRDSWIWFVGLLQKYGMIKLDVKNIEKLKNLKNSIIVSTHPSFVDIVILMSIIPNSTCFVAEKLSRNPVLKKIIERLFIPEGLTVEEMLKEIKTKCDENLNIIIFPMGTRHKKDEYPKIRRGTALIARETGRDIDMLKIETSIGFLQSHQPFYDVGTEPAVFTIDYLGKIEIKDYMQYDEVTFKTKITKEITKYLYNK